MRKKSNTMLVITGVNGFSGNYLVQYIKEQDPQIKIIGIDNNNTLLNKNLDRFFSISEFEEFSQFLINIDEEVQIIHLGGLIGNHNLPSLIEANVLWTSKYLHLFSQLKNPVTFLNIGSSAEYGNQTAHFLSEELTPDPINNYGISKYLQASLVTSFISSKEVKIVSARTFNLIGPGMSKNLVIGKLLNEFMQVYRGEKENIEIGRLDSIRDFIDIRDAVQYYYQLLQIKEKLKYINVASGTSNSISDILNLISDKLSINPKIEQYSNLKSMGDIDCQYSDISKLRQLFPQIRCRSIEESISDMIDYEQKK